MYTFAILEKLRAQGADVDAALERFVDDEELYCDCLAEFAGDKAFATLQRALESGGHSASFDAAHSLKGLSGNLGLSSMYTSVCTLVEALRAGELDGIESKYRSVLSKQEELKAILKQ